MTKFIRLTAVFMAILVGVLCCACNAPAPDVSQAVSQIEVIENNDIVVLYTNDIHSAFETDIGFSGLSAYKKLVLEKTPYVTLVDCGDAIQGEVIGAVSKGEYIVDIMNKVGYDLAVLGNHEFDYGMDRLTQLIEHANHSYLACNITYSGGSVNKLASVKPYEIKEYGETAVAFIGVSTPETTTSTSPTSFMEDGEFVYGFSAGEEGKLLYNTVQGYIDECKSKGADYIVLMTHLGDVAEQNYTSVDLINNTTGVDVVLDGHSHNTIPTRIELNKDGEEVILSSTGTKFANFGQLVITANGYITAGLISEYTQKDAELDGDVAKIKELYEAEVNKVIGSSSIDLSCYDENGIRLVRNRETAIANLCADAYRYVTGADVALVNGGGVRENIKKGELTYADIIAVHPFGNMLCVVEATGQEILDSLEIASRATQSEYSKDGYALGEEGSFQQVSGLKYTIDTTIPSGVIFDENAMFKEFTGERRVKNVSVLNSDGDYVPIDPNKIYTVASHNHLIKSSGGGITQFSDNKLLVDEALSDYQVLITYISEYLGGNIGEEYASPEGRITVN